MRIKWENVKCSVQHTSWINGTHGWHLLFICFMHLVCSNSDLSMAGHHRGNCTVPGIQQALNTWWWQKVWSLSGCWHLLLDILDVHPRSWFNSLSLNFVDWHSLLYCFDSWFLRLLRSLREERHGLHVNSDFFQPRSLLLKVWSGDQQYWQHQGTCYKYGIPAPSEPSESESVF